MPRPHVSGRHTARRFAGALSRRQRTCGKFVRPAQSRRYDEKVSPDISSSEPERQRRPWVKQGLRWRSGSTHLILGSNMTIAQQPNRRELLTTAGTLALTAGTAA